MVPECMGDHNFPSIGHVISRGLNEEKRFELNGVHWRSRTIEVCCGNKKSTYSSRIVREHGWKEHRLNVVVLLTS